MSEHSIQHSAISIQPAKVVASSAVGRWWLNAEC
jgi:hypothetical protein